MRSTAKALYLLICVVAVRQTHYNFLRIARQRKDVQAKVSPGTTKLVMTKTTDTEKAEAVFLVWGLERECGGGVLTEGPGLCQGKG